MAGASNTLESPGTSNQTNLSLSNTPPYGAHAENFGRTEGVVDLAKIARSAEIKLGHSPRVVEVMQFFSLVEMTCAVNRVSRETSSP
jgi:hypothetical protein